MKALDAYRRMRYWAVWFVILNVTTWIMLGTVSTFVWWPVALVFFHFGRSVAYMEAAELRADGR